MDLPNPRKLPKLVVIFIYVVKEIYRRIRRFFHIRAGELPDLIVCSPGGVATTLFINHASRFLVCNQSDDSDALKHLRDPVPKRIKAKTIYIDGETDEIIESLRRRQYAMAQYIKLAPLVRLVWVPLVFHKLKLLDLRHVIEAQRSRFLSDERIFITNYHEIFSRGKEIAELFGLPEDFWICFPEKRERTPRNKGPSTH